MVVWSGLVSGSGSSSSTTSSNSNAVFEWYANYFHVITVISWLSAQLVAYIWLFAVHFIDQPEAASLLNDDHPQQSTTTTTTTREVRRIIF